MRQATRRGGKKLLAGSLLSIEQDNMSDMGPVRKNLWNKRCPSDDAQSEESGGVLVVPAVAAAKSSSRHYHDYNSSSEEEQWM